VSFTDENTRASERRENVEKVTDAINQGVESPDE
jgi:hypothetical protein